MARKPKTTAAKADAAVSALFTTAPQNRTTAQKIAAKDTTPADKPGRRPSAGTTKPDAKDPAANDFHKRAAAAFGMQPDTAKLDISPDDIPTLDTPWMKIQERTFTLEDPEAEYDELEEALRLTEALTPGNLEQALNDAEDNARRAHKLYVVARAEYEAFERESTPIMEAMRESANRELQAEKDNKQRSKAITDADIKGRASILFPDEWAVVMGRRSKAEAMMDHLKVFADLWKQRCYSLSTMLHAGKR